MQRAFELTFRIKKGDFRLGITLEKSFEQRLSFKRGYNGQPVKQIQVVPTDSSVEKIVEKKQISRVVQYSDLQSLWPTGDTDENGSSTFVVIDKASLKNAFPSSPEMLVSQIVSRSAIPIQKLEGSHYFVCVKMTKKGKDRVANPDDVALYNILWHGLSFNGEAMVVSYVAMNNNKGAILYATEEDGQRVLRLANMIGDNHQKRVKEKQKITAKFDKQDIKRYEKLISTLRVDDFTPTYNDDYADKLEEVVQASLRGEVVKPLTQKKRSTSSRLSALDSEDEEEEDEE